MEELWSIYHPDIPDFLQKLSRTPAMARLRQVGMNCGCEYTSFPLFRDLRPYSRFDHSMGVALIVWHFTGSKAQSIAGALHDIATPVFAHTVDFLLGDHVTQGATEHRTTELIETSPEICAILEDIGLTVEDVADYHRYPIADNNAPRLAADRLEYSLGNLFNYGFCSLEQVKTLYEDLAVDTNEDGIAELSFKNAEKAIRFTELALKASRVYVADEDRFSMEMLAALLRLGLERGALCLNHLHTTEPEVISRLLEDPVCREKWQQFCAFSAVRQEVERPDTGHWICVPAKLRYIDPLIQQKGRVSQQSDYCRHLLEDFRKIRFDYWVGCDT